MIECFQRVCAAAPEIVRGYLRSIRQSEYRGRHKPARLANPSPRRVWPREATEYGAQNFWEDYDT